MPITNSDGSYEGDAPMTAWERLLAVLGVVLTGGPDEGFIDRLFGVEMAVMVTHASSPHEEPWELLRRTFVRLDCFADSSPSLEVGLAKWIRGAMGRDAPPVRETRLVSLPPYVVIELRRFYSKSSPPEVISVLRFPLLLDLYPLCAHATQRVHRQHRDAAEPMGLDDEEPWMAPQGSPRHSAPDPTDVIMVLSEEESGVAARTLPIRHRTVPVSFAIPMDLVRAVCRRCWG